MNDYGTFITTTDGKKKIGMMDMSPILKKPCLVMYEEPNRYIKVASFNDSQAAIAFMQYLADMFGIEKGEE